VIVVVPVGTVLPVIPGVLMVFGGLLVAAWPMATPRVVSSAVHHRRLGLLSLSRISPLLVGAKRVGASPRRSPARRWAARSGSSWASPA